MRGKWMLLCALTAIVGLSGCATPHSNQLASGCPNGGLDESGLSQRKALDCEGKYYLKKGKYEHAVENFTAALQVDPNDAKTYYNRSLALRALGQTDKADADVAKAHQLDPSLPPT